MDMDKEALKKAIEDKLEVIREQFEIIRQHESKIPSIELDLVMDNLRQLYEYFLMLDRENMPTIPFSLDKERNNKSQVFSPIDHAEDMEEDTPSPGIEPEEPSFDQQEEGPSADNIAEESNDIREKEIKEEIQPVTEEVKSGAPGVQTRENSMPRSTYDLFNEPTATVADKLKNHDEPRVADKLKQNHLEDVRKGIGINEKFRFLNDLFDGNMKGYEETINQVNDCKTYGEAFMLIDEMKRERNWNEGDESLKIFLSIIKRRF